MINIVEKWEGISKLILEIDTSQDFGPSSSGKNNIIASSGGYQTITTPEGKMVKFNLNVIYKPKQGG